MYTHNCRIKDAIPLRNRPDPIARNSVEEPSDNPLSQVNTYSTNLSNRGIGKPHTVTLMVKQSLAENLNSTY